MIFGNKTGFLGNNLANVDHISMNMRDTRSMKVFKIFSKLQKIRWKTGDKSVPRMGSDRVRWHISCRTSKTIKLSFAGWICSLLFFFFHFFVCFFNSSYSIYASIIAELSQASSQLIQKHRKKLLKTIIQSSVETYKRKSTSPFQTCKKY